jgi:protein TonB
MTAFNQRMHISADSRPKSISFALSALLHGLLLAGVFSLWNQLGNQARNVDVDLVMITDGTMSYQTAPDAQNDNAEVAQATVDNVQPPVPSQADNQPAASKPPPLPAADVSPPVVPPVAPPPVPTPVEPPQPAASPPVAPSSDVAVLTAPSPVPAPDPPPPPPPPMPVAQPPPPVPPPVAPPKPQPVVKPAPIKPAPTKTPDDGIDIPAPAPSANANLAPIAPPAPPTPPSSSSNSGSGTSGGSSSKGQLALVSSPPPNYPNESRQEGEEGRVTVRAEVGIDGVPRNVGVAVSSGHPRLDEAALTAVRGWRFRNDMGNKVDVTVPVRFALSDSPGTAPVSSVTPSPTAPPPSAPAIPGPAPAPARSNYSAAPPSLVTPSAPPPAGRAGADAVTVLSSPAPVYPPDARSRGEEGRVIVRAQIGTDGRPFNISVETTSGYPQLDAAATACVRDWRFRNNSGVVVDMTVPIRFVLRPNG